MSHLAYLERTLGSVHSWPQEILCYLFTTPPTVDTLRDLAAFFFGNKFPSPWLPNFLRSVSLPPKTS